MVISVTGRCRDERLDLRYGLVGLFLRRNWSSIHDGCCGYDSGSHRNPDHHSRNGCGDLGKQSKTVKPVTRGTNPRLGE